MKMTDLPSIFKCEEYIAKSYPPYLLTYSNVTNAIMPCIFSFAYTPTGRISQYWCALQFNVPYPSEERIERWEKNERPKLRKGYRWSRVFSYSQYIK